MLCEVPALGPWKNVYELKEAVERTGTYLYEWPKPAFIDKAYQYRLKKFNKEGTFGKVFQCAAE